jgi:hypothetical protein
VVAVAPAVPRLLGPDHEAESHTLAPLICREYFHLDHVPDHFPDHDEGAMARSQKGAWLRQLGPHFEDG